MSDELRAVGLEECCRRLGISKRLGEKLLADGKFPIPELPRLGTVRTFSTYDINEYLRLAATRDVLTPSTRRRYGLVSSK